MSEPEYDSALAQHLRTRDDVLGLNLFGGGEAVTTSSAKITTTWYKINRTTRNMPNLCTQRKGSERRADAEDVSLLINVLTERNCGCELHGAPAASLQLRNLLDSMRLVSLSSSGCCGIPPLRTI